MACWPRFPQLSYRAMSCPFELMYETTRESNRDSGDEPCCFWPSPSRCRAVWLSVLQLLTLPPHSTMEAAYPFLPCRALGGPGKAPFQEQPVASVGLA